MPTPSAPLSTDGRPRGSAKTDRPTLLVPLVRCTSTGRRKSTATSPVLIRSAISVRPERFTEPSSPWEIQI
jgi:hypothetical protein